MCGWRSSITLPSRRVSADVAGEVVRIGIVGIDAVADLLGERDHRGLLHRVVGEIAQAHIAADEAGGDAIGLRELPGVAVARRLLGGERLPEAMHRALADVADHLGDVVGLDAARAEPPRAVDVGMRHGPAGIELEGERLRQPARAEIAGHRVEVARRGVGEAVEEAVRALEHRARPGEAGPRQQRRAHARLRRPAGVHPLGPGALGEIFDDARRHRADDAERVDHLLLVELERLADGGGGAHRAEHRGRMKARLVHHLRRDQAEPAHQLDADRDAFERGLAVDAVALADGEHRRHDHRAGVDRAALEGVVEILAVGRGAVDEGRARRAQPRACGRSRCRGRPRPSRRARCRHSPRCARRCRGRSRRSVVSSHFSRAAAGSVPASTAAMRSARCSAMAMSGSFASMAIPCTASRRRMLGRMA